MTKITELSPSSKFPVIVEGHGPIPCPFMVIGEAPGREEIKEGIPFVGRSGQLLRSTLEEFGATECYITNIYKGDVGIGNRDPSREEIEAHQDILIEEINAVDPAGILLVGGIAIRHFFPYVMQLAEVVGTRIASDGRQFYPCYHPAYILYNSNFKEEFRYAVARFVLTTEVLSRYEHP